MRYLMISDIHGNLEALQAALELADKFKPYQLVCLGDIVGYGADPKACIDIMGEKANLVLAGNHDLAVAGIISSEDFNPIALESLKWTEGILSDEEKELLANLPLQYIDGDYCFTHASPIEPMNFHYVRTVEDVEEVFSAIGQRFCFIGHTHLPVIARISMENGKLDIVRETRTDLLDEFRYFVNVGSIGQPRDSNPDACMVLFDEEYQTLEFIRVPYDITTSRDKIISEGLPSYLAERLTLAR
ncbi:MAG: metallophosphoesterase [Candidatus Latescibacteria bacterium]|nr:metallophosphoesterase [Candidatus Latescibacterota bacterium]NIM66442.1 metallophosphoesterase [Candidatus Latescibacterota bacterium]NIO02922.1 metallophosphoesterase [Candidatus Latescibacterota bacterium]NIO30057.1 metallophosphoesterase [Candidatus Latescibacterota bacterium]NIO57672.1 metallophosphoesterase [Candidatus Latescibacterota bacterium]